MVLNSEEVALLINFVLFKCGKTKPMFCSSVQVYAPYEEKENFVHIEVFEDLEGNTELLKIQDGHKYPDPIEPL